MLDRSFSLGGALRFSAWSPALLVLAATVLGGCRGGLDRGAVLCGDGLDALAQGDTIAARAALEASLFHDPHSARALFHCGRLWAARGDIEARARGEQLLRRAVDRAPTVGAYRAALGEVLHLQGFHRESAATLAAAVQLDSTLAQAWFLLGVEMQRLWLDEPTTPALRDSSMRCYARTLSADPRQDEARYRLAFLHMVRGDLDRARDLAAPLAYGRDCPGRFGLLLAAIDGRARRFGGAATLLAATLRCLPASEREVILGLRCVLHPDSADTYAEHGLADRESLVAAFWFQRDPTPATLANERLIEHVSRVVESDFYFTVPSLRRRGALTDRGEIYTRYGPPRACERDASLSAPAWRWAYGNNAEMSFIFVDEYHSGDYRRVRRHAGSDFSRREPLELEPEITAFAFRRPPQPCPRVVRHFRGEDGRTALEIAFELPLDSSIAAVRVEAAGWSRPGQLGIQSDLMMRRGDLYDLGDGRSIGRLRLEGVDGSNVLGLECTALSRTGSDREVYTPEWTAAGRERIEPQSTRSDALAMSDLVLAHRVENGSGGPFDFGGIRVIPRVGALIEDIRLDLYFEVYPSRAMQLDRRTLAVSYRVLPQPPAWRFRDQFRHARRTWERPVVEATFNLSATVSVQRQPLAIDVRALEPGTYRLVVEVRDPAEGSVDSRATTFVLPTPSSAGGR